MHPPVDFLYGNFLYLPLPPYLCGKFWDRYGIQELQIFIGRGFQLGFDIFF